MPLEDHQNWREVPQIVYTVWWEHWADYKGNVL